MSWLQRNGFRLAAASTVVAGVVLVAGWTSGVRAVMYDVLLTLLGVAFLPFVLIAGGLALLMVIVLLASVIDFDPVDVDAAGSVVAFGLELIIPYYNFLASIRHPFLIAIPTGIIVGCLGLWVSMSLVIVPKEMATAEILARTKAQIEEQYGTLGNFPEPQHGKLVIDGEPLIDAFGRPVLYDTPKSVTKLAAFFELRSLGADGERSEDDLCLRGGTKLRVLADKALDRALATLLGSEPSAEERVDAALAMKCESAD